MVKGLPIEELTPETRKLLKLTSKHIPQRVIVLGKLLLALEGLSGRDALWALREAGNHARGRRVRRNER